jgi:hypothetical protein
MSFIDQQYSHRTVHGRLKRGNTPNKRLWESKSVNTSCRAKPGLPRNVYNRDALLEDAIDSLDAVEPVMLPAVRQ